MKNGNSKPAIVVRDAGEQDAPRLLAMIRALALHHDDVPKITADALARDTSGGFPWIYMLVAETDGTLVGYAALSPLIQLQIGMRGMDMHHLFVEEKFRGRGVGNTLIEASMQKARALSCGYMMVGTHRDNTDAQSVYLAFGFEPQRGSNPRFRISL